MVMRVIKGLGEPRLPKVGTDVLLDELRRVLGGELLPDMDLLERVMDRLGVLEEENAALKRWISYDRPKKARSPADWRFRVTSFEWREMKIAPREFPEGKTIRVLRLHVPREDVPGGPAYWDITRKREIAILEPLLPVLVGTGRYVHIVQDGEGTASQFMIHLEGM